MTPTPREQVVLDDPLPAGLEPVDASLATTAQSLDVDGAGRRRGRRRRASRPTTTRAARGAAWGSAWYHREMHDDRVLTFVEHMPAGMYHYRYLARATTVGAVPRAADEGRVHVRPGGLRADGGVRAPGDRAVIAARRTHRARADLARGGWRGALVLARGRAAVRARSSVAAATMALPAELREGARLGVHPLRRSRRARRCARCGPTTRRARAAVALDEVGDDLVHAVLAAEDRRFFEHPGVDALAVARAACVRRGARARRVRAPRR